MARGGHGGRRGGSQGDLPRSVQISKKLSWLLRHGAESEGLELGPGGYANLQDVLHNRKLRGLRVTFDEVRSVVAENDKQRFSMKPLDGTSSSEAEAATASSDASIGNTRPGLDYTNPANWLIRANQGHSIKVAEEGLLEPITLEAGNVPETVVHGTTARAWPLILKSGGLKPMSRTQVHFASGLPDGFTSLETLGEGEQREKQPVISGMRNSSKIIIFLDAEKVLKGGLKLWRSANGVVLCAGNEEGIIPVEMFKRVEERGTDGRVLVRDGVVLESK